MPSSILPPNTRIVDDLGRVTPEWYRYFVDQKRNSDAAGAGEVGTATESGLSGGGMVSNGVNLSIADNGVTNARLRDSAGVSVIGRFVASAGDPADIVAGGDQRVLCRENGELAFLESINCNIGQITPKRGAFTSLKVAVRASSVDTTFGSDDYCITVDASGAARTITLPALAASAGRMFVLKKTDASANTVTLDANGAETIDGAATYVLTAQYEAVTVIGGISEWHVI